MSDVKCPECGLVMRGGIAPDDESKCKQLRGTKYLDSEQFALAGVRWCPSLSDAAPADAMLLAPDHREQVLAAIAAAKKTK
jgi:hypothetical protein